MSYMNKKEYSASPVGGSGCSYTSLGQYYGNRSRMAPARCGSTGGGGMTVPVFGAMSYKTLSHGNTTPSCGQYFNINSAYGGCPATSYSKRTCN